MVQTPSTRAGVPLQMMDWVSVGATLCGRPVGGRGGGIYAAYGPTGHLRRGAPTNDGLGFCRGDPMRSP